MAKKKVESEEVVEETIVEETIEEQLAEEVVEEVIESGPVEVTISFKEESLVLEGKTKVAIKSLEFRPRGKAGSYRPGAAYVLEAKEAAELIEAGIASLIEEDCKADLSFPTPDPE